MDKILGSEGYHEHCRVYCDHIAMYGSKLHMLENFGVEQIKLTSAIPKKIYISIVLHLISLRTSKEIILHFMKSL